MSTVHQVIAAAAPYDAVTDQALRLQARLREWGRRSGIVAEHVHPSMAGEVTRLDRGGRAMLEEGAVVLRYSIWSEAAAAVIDSGAPVGLIYHNVTPGHLLRAANPAVADLCDAGRRGLVRVARRASVLVADSAFNAADLAGLGLPGARVVPLLLDPVVPPDRAVPPPGPPCVLTVGRIVPNKRLEDLLRVAALLQRSRAPEARVVVVGGDDGFATYRAALDGLATSLGVRNLVFTGRVPDALRDRAYTEASAYLCMSVHEGFCAPVVEAMQHGVPVVARGGTAVTETLGPGGIVLDDDDLALFAEAVWEVSTSTGVRAELQERMRARLAELDPDRVAARLREALVPLLEGA